MGAGPLTRTHTHTPACVFTPALSYVADYERWVELDPSGSRAAQADIARVKAAQASRDEKMKEEMMGKLKDLGEYAAVVAHEWPRRAARAPFRASVTEHPFSFDPAILSVRAGNSVLGYFGLSMGE